MIMSVLGTKDAKAVKTDKQQPTPRVSNWKHFCFEGVGRREGGRREGGKGRDYSNWNADIII